MRLIKNTGITAFLFFFMLQLILLQKPLHALEIFNQEGVCSQDTETSEECIDILPVTPQNPSKYEKKQPVEKKDTVKPKATHTIPLNREKIVLYFFWGDGCPHCKVEKIFLDEMKRRYPSLEIRDYEVWYSQKNASLLTKMAEAYYLQASGVPVTFIGEHAFVGFSGQSKKDIAEAIEDCLSKPCIDPFVVLSGMESVETPKEGAGSAGISSESEELECKEAGKTVFIPWLGNLDVSEMSLPVITVVIAGLDSFNPCAFFVLFALLGLLIHAKSRTKMFLIGTVFVFFSGFTYFLFMAAWLNLFLVMGQVGIITKIAGITAILIASVNIKDFFLFKKGISLTIPDTAKPKLFDRMRRLLKSSSPVSILIGASILAIAANSYELLCTAGFPMVFTRILTLNQLPTPSYYAYLVLYNSIYIVPLLSIVLVLTLTLGKKKITEWQGKILKLVSGIMMIGLGGILLINPSILNSMTASVVLLLGTLVISAIVVFSVKKIKIS
jgi:thiol-disulfide isomerase/thioredoxin